MGHIWWDLFLRCFGLNVWDISVRVDAAIFLAYLSSLLRVRVVFWTPFPLKFYVWLNPSLSLSRSRCFFNACVRIA